MASFIEESKASLNQELASLSKQIQSERQSRVANTETDAEFFCQALIQPGAFAPKAVLHMARRQPKAAFVPKKGQPVQKCHAVAAAADRRQQQGVFLPQTRCLQRAFQLRKQAFFHA